MTKQEIIEMYNVISLNEAGEITTYKNLKEHAEELADRIVKRFESQNEALKAIAEPISYLQKEAEKEGAKLDGRAAMQIIKEPSFYQEIARKALGAVAAK